MPNIEKNVVQMMFDNKQFEQGVKQSTRSLENLKKGLELDKATQSLANLEKTVGGFNFSGLSNSVESISDKFSMLGILGVTAMQKIADAAVNAGAKLVKSISIDQVSAGMSKYETQTRAVQVITNATGKSVAEVEKVLATLMKYTDETSYDFSTMVQTIGKFTAVGVDLELAEKAMEGISNEAAKSGASVQEANRAMYNFAQALSTGSVRLIDWKSIENANMATKEFKEQLITTAIELGTVQKKSDGVGKIMKQTSKATKKTAAQFKETEVNYKTFNSTLSEGWLTSDVLIKTLAKYSDTTTKFGLDAFHAAQEALTFTDALNAVKDAVSSGWMNTFKYLFGDLNEARQLWTKVANSMYDFVAVFFDTRNEILKNWHELGGYKDAVEAVSNVWHTFMNIFTVVKDAFSEFVVGSGIEEISYYLYEFTNNLKESTEQLRKFFAIDEYEDVEYTVSHIADLSDRIKRNLSKGDKGEDVKFLQERLIKQGLLDKNGADGIYGPKTEAAVKKLQQKLGVDATGAFDAVTKKAASAKGIFNEYTTSTEKTIEYTSRLSDTMEKFQHIVEGVANVIKHIRYTFQVAKIVIKNFLSSFKPLFDPIFRVLDIIGIALKNLSLTNNISKIGGQIIKTFKPFKDFIKGIADAINDFVDRYLKFATKMVGVAKDGKLFGYVERTFINFGTIFGFLEQEIRKTKIGKFLFDIIDKIKPVLGTIGEIFDKVKDAVVGFFTMDVKDSNGFFDSIQKRFGSFKDLWENIKTSISKLFNPQGAENGAENAEKSLDIFQVIGEKVKAIIDFVKTINVAQLALFAIGLYSAFKMYQRIKAPMDFVSNISKFVKAGKQTLQQHNASRWMTSIGEFVKSIGLGVALIAASIYAIGQLDIGKALLATGIIAAIMGMMIGLAFAMKKLELSSVEMKGILGISAAVLILANAVVKLGALEFGRMMGALLGLTILLGELLVFNKLMKGQKFEIGGMIDIGTGVSMLVGAVVNLSKLDSDQIKKGLIALGGLLLELGVFLKISNGTGINMKLGQMIGIGISVYLLAMSLKKISKLSWEGIMKGLVGLGAVLLELGLFLRLTSGFGSSKGLLGMVGIGITVLLIAKALEGLAKIDGKGILKGVMALAVIFLEIAIFMKLIGGNNALKQIGLAFALVGIGVALGLVVLSFKSLAKMKGKAILKGVIALGAIFLEIAAFMKLIGGRNPLRMMGNAVAMIGIGAALNLFVIAIAGLSMIKAGDLIKSIVAIGVLFLEIAAFLKIIGNTSTSLKALPVLITVAGTLLLFGLALYAVAGVPWTVIAAFGVSFGIALSAVGGAMAVLGNMPIKSALMGIANLDLFIANLVLILAAFKGLQELTGGAFGEWMRDGAEVIGQVIGGFISGIINGVNHDKPQEKKKTLSDYIKEFLKDIESIIPSLKSLGEKGKSLKTDGLKVIADAMGQFVIIAGSLLVIDFVEILKNIMDFLSSTDNLKEFIQDVTMLLPFIVGLSNFKDKINVDTLKNIADGFGHFVTMAGAILAISFAELIKNVADFLNGRDSLINFINQINILLPYIVGLSKFKTKINVDTLKNIADSMGYFAKMAVSLLATSFIDLLSNILTFREAATLISGFVNKIIDIVPYLALLSEWKGKINVNVLKNIANAMDALSLMASASLGVSWKDFVSNIASFITGKTGSSVVKDFVQTMVDVAPKLEELGTKTGNINIKAIEVAAGALSALAKVANEIPPTNGLLQGIIGTQDLASFGSKLSTLGNGLYDFAVATNAIPTDYDVNGPVKALESLSALESGLEAHGGFAQWFTGEKSLSNFGEEIKGLGEDLKIFFDSTAQINGTKLASIGRGIEMLGKGVSSVPNEMDSQAGISSLQYILNAITNPEILDFSKIENVGVDVCNSIKTGISNNVSVVTDEVDPMIDSLIATLAEYYDSFKDIGELFDTGIAQGITDHVSTITTAARNAAIDAYNAACNELKIESPSKKGAYLGEMFDAGFVVGLKNYQDKIGSQSSDTVSTAVDNARLAINDLSNVISSDADNTPIIRPVVDGSMALSQMEDIRKKSEGMNYQSTFSIAQTSRRAHSISGEMIPSTNTMDTAIAKRDKMFSDAIDRISSHMDKLDEGIRNLKMYINGSVLVGEITPDIDKALGKRATQARRMN